MTKIATVRLADGLERLPGSTSRHIVKNVSAMPAVPDLQSTKLDDCWIDQPIYTRFEQVAARLPEKIALDDGHMRLTYRDVLQAAQHLAHRIAAVAPIGRPVGIFLPNSALFPVAALACLATGRIYVPLDLNYPVERNALILREAGLAAAIFDGNCGKPVMDLGDLPCMDIAASLGCSDNARVSVAHAEGPAVVLYTSGSSGRPKGICNDQRAILQRVVQFTLACDLNADDRFLLLSSPGTIAGIRDTFAALLNGATLYIADPQRVGIGGILGAARDHRITIMYAVPALAREIFRQPVARQAFVDMRVLRLGGDSILASDIALCRTAVPATARILVGYGSTEVPTVFQWFVPADWTPDGSTVPCGYASPDVRFSLINELGANAAPGEVAEVVVSSRYVAIGLWQDGRLQREAFATAPDDPAARVVHTGDLVRLRASGLVDLIGRKDRQIKVRGFRVDPGDIESVLRGCAEVTDAAVLCRRVDGADVLCAYVVPRDPASPSLSAALDEARKTLPLHMRPAHVHVVGAIPRLPGYKPDIKLLERMESTGLVTNAGTAPASELEAKMLEIWRKMLDRDELGVTDNFFDAGGNSLMAMELTLAIEAQLNREVSLETIFKAPTIKALCLAMEENGVCNHAAVMPIRSGESGATLYFIHSGFEFSALSNALPRGISTAFVTTNSLKWLREVTASGNALAAVDQISEAYAQAIFARRETGPIYLAGHSFGGILAIETACKLEAMGAAPADIFLFDTYLHGSLHRIRHDLRYNGWLGRKWSEFVGGNRREIVRRARFLAANAWRRLTRRVVPETAPAMAAGSSHAERDLQVIFRDLREAGSQAYRGPARPLSSNVALFQATQTVDGRRMHPDPDLGWAKQFAKTLTVIPAPGDHYSLLTGVQAAVLATEIAKRVGQHALVKPVNIARYRMVKSEDRFFDHIDPLAA